MERRETRFLERKKVKPVSYFDFTLLFLVFIISMLGLVFIYSSSSYIAQVKNLPQLHFVSKQKTSIIVGSFFMFIAILVPYRFYIGRVKFLNKLRISHLILVFAYILQITVLLLVDERNGSARWIGMKGLGTIQPSEISKLAIILYTSMVCYQKPKKFNSLIEAFKSTYLVIPLIALIAKENLSTAIIAGIIYIGICFVTSKKYGYFIFIFFLSIVLVLVLVRFGGGYRRERFKIWQNLETEEKGAQILQGLYAISSGGIIGSGLGNSAGKFNRIPEAYNDMIFTIICEEHGLLGGLAVLMLYVFLVVRLYVIARNAPDLLGTLITVGVMTQIAVQAILNVAVVTNMIPSTGVTLPFISYGGSSIIILLSEIGIVLNISKSIKYFPEYQEEV